MEKGIYKYSPALQFEIGRLGSAFVNLCTQSPSLYIDLPLYESQSIGGLNLHCYVLDAGSTYETFTFNCTFKFSYDVSLTVSSSTELCVNNPSGSKHKYQLNTSNNRYESLEDKSYVVSLYNEETCLTTYTLFDESENENVFVRSGTTHYLNLIKLKNGKEITITRDTSNRILQVENPLSNERIKFAYYESIITVQVKPLTDNQTLYEFIYYIDDNENFEIVYYTSNVYRYVNLICSSSSFVVQEEALGGDIFSTNTFTRNSTTKKITKFTDNNNNITDISYGNRYATITNNRNDEQTKYVWDHIGRLTHVYDLKRNTFSNISYDSYNHVVIKSSNLFNTKILNPNYIGSSTGKTNTFDYQGKVNDLFSVIVVASYNYTLQFKINIVFEKLDDNNNVIESDSVEPYDYDIYNYGTSNPYVFSTYSNINFNRVKVVITETQGSGTYSVYLYNAGFTENYLYKGKLLVGALKYGSLTGFTVTNNRIISSSSGVPEYDEKDRLIKFTDSYGNIMEYTYDENDNVLSVKTRKGSYVPTKTYTYDSTNNRQLTEKDDSVSSLIKSTTLDNRGLFSSSKVINSSNVELESVTAEYNSNSTPLYNKLTQVYNHNNDSNPITDVIEYTYENKELVKTTFDGRSVSYTINEKPHDYDNVKLNNINIVEYTYKTKNVSGVEIATELIESKTYQNGAYYFEYDSNDKLTAVKYSASFSSTDATTLHTFEYQTINGNDVLSKVTSTSPLFGSNIKEYCYDKYGNLVGTKQTGNGNNFNEFACANNKITQINNQTIITKKETQYGKSKLLFANYVRAHKSNIKLCDFSISIDNEDVSSLTSTKVYSVLCNNIVDKEIDETSDNFLNHYKIGEEWFNESKNKISSNMLKTDGTMKYISINPSSYKTDSEFANYVFDFSNGNFLSNSNQTVAFTFKNEYLDGETSVLLAIKNFDGVDEFIFNSSDLLVVLENTSNYSFIKLCSASNSNDSLDITQIGDLSIPLPKDNNKWHFVSVTYSESKLVLFVDGLYIEHTLSTSKIRNAKMLYFGMNIASNYNSYITNNNADFDLSNIIVPYKKSLSLDEIATLWNLFETRNEVVTNELLDSSNASSNTTFNTVFELPNTVNKEYISFDKSLVSSSGLRPSIDYSMASLLDTNLKKFVFDDSTYNYAYKLCGKQITYEIDSTTYSKTLSVSFMFKPNGTINETHNLLKLASSQLEVALAYMNGALYFDSNTSLSPLSTDISDSEWSLITLTMDQTVDNCSNQVFEYKFELFINGVYKASQTISLSTEFLGFSEMLVDFISTTNCNETDSPCLIKDLLLCDVLIETAEMNKLNNKSFINTQFDSLGLKTNEKIVKDNVEIINTSFEYDSNTRFKKESVIGTSDNRIYTYTFDDFGRVTKQVIAQPGISNEYHEISYTYDNKGQLVKEKYTTIAQAGNSSSESTYTYDDYGNMTSYVDYDGGTHTFTYDTDNKLTSIDGQEVTFNISSGRMSLNPSSINGMTLTFTGRNLSTLVSDTAAIRFDYNEQGLRTYKINSKNQTFYEYFYDLDGKLIADNKVASTGAEDRINFLYHNNYLYGFTHNGTYYYYLRDSLGCINGIFDASGNLVVEYRYNAFGKILDITGELKDTIGVYNPIRYKGYYYDVETSMYYCHSRYYYPEICRWISGNNEKCLNSLNIIGLNLFAYCHNNPIYFIDSFGDYPIKLKQNKQGQKRNLYNILNIHHPKQLTNIMKEILNMISYNYYLLNNIFTNTLDDNLDGSTSQGESTESKHSNSHSNLEQNFPYTKVAEEHDVKQIPDDYSDALPNVNSKGYLIGKMGIVNPSFDNLDDWWWGI